MTGTDANDGAILVDRVLPGIGEIVIDRPAKRNAFTPAMLDGLAHAFTELEEAPDIRVLLLHARGDHFTGGLDLGRMDAAGRMGEPLFPAGLVEPIGLTGRKRTKPLVMAVEGFCYTLGVELLLAADIGVASRAATFAQIEVQRSILPYGGATIRMPERFGWGNAMRYLLTGDSFDAETAYRLGLVQDLVEPGESLAVARGIAARIAEAAPLAVRAVLESSRITMEQGGVAAADRLLPAARAVAATEDAAEGVAAFLDRRPARYRGQ